MCFYNTNVKRLQSIFCNISYISLVIFKLLLFSPFHWYSFLSYLPASCSSPNDLHFTLFYLLQHFFLNSTLFKSQYILLCFSLKVIQPQCTDSISLKSSLVLCRFHPSPITTTTLPPACLPKYQRFKHSSYTYVIQSRGDAIKKKLIEIFPNRSFQQTESLHELIENYFQ